MADATTSAAATTAAGAATTSSATTPVADAKVNAAATTAAASGETTTAPVVVAKDSAAEVKPADAKAAVPVALKLPEGVKPTAAFEKFSAFAKESGLASDAAQKVVDFSLKLEAESKAQAEADNKAQLAEWESALKADKDIGGAKYEASVALAKKAIAKFGSPELAQVLDVSGMGSHPEVMRAFVRIGKALSEDSIAGATQGGAAAERTEEQFHRGLYPNSPSLFPKRQA